MHPRRHRPATNHEPVARHAFEDGPELHRHRTTRLIADRHDDFDAGQVEVFEAICREGLRRPKADALPMARLSNPVTQVAEVVVEVEVIQPHAAEKFLAIVAEDAALEARSTDEALLAQDEPSL